MILTSSSRSSHELRSLASDSIKTYTCNQETLNVDFLNDPWINEASHIT